MFITCVFCVISFSSKQNETTDERLKVSKQKAKDKSNSSSSEESSDSSSEDKPGLCVCMYFWVSLYHYAVNLSGDQPQFILMLMLY